MSTLGANAQDAPYDWAGGYVGASFAAHRLSHDFDMPGIGLNEQNSHYDWVNSGSAFAGYQWALPHGFVAGLELSATVYDADKEQMDFESSGAAYGSIGETDVIAVMASQLKYSGSLQARLGYAFDRVLLFAAAGPAIGTTRLWGASSSSNKASLDPDTFSLSDLAEGDAQTLVGATVAVGAEVGLTQKLSGRLKFENTYWGGYPNFDAKLCASCPVEKIDITSSVQQWSVGLSYRF